ncbi:protease complex subunit PrcB family protein [Salinisphaera orenii]|uniref:protease complex subunit PrcB family protein n=1 Tax=Salinisphaera orenii TaxID=856731 RepID=UPI0013A66C7A
MTSFRLLIVLACIIPLSACALLPRSHWRDMDVIASSDYCGTPSEASGVKYFAKPSTFSTWINERNLSAFDPDMAAKNGVIVAEMGQRATDGYDIQLLPKKTRIENKTLVVAMKWTAPGLNAKVSQALNSRCIAFNPPKGDYDRIKLVDQLGDKRGETAFYRPSKSSRS